MLVLEDEGVVINMLIWVLRYEVLVDFFDLFSCLYHQKYLMICIVYYNDSDVPTSQKYNQNFFHKFNIEKRLLIN